MKQQPSEYTESSSVLVKFLLDANHGNPLEHVVFTFQISGVSRSFLAQITRHRMSSFTTSSQHYQDYRDYPLVMGPGVADWIVESSPDDWNSLDSVYQDYALMIDQGGLLPEEARQILPNAAAVNIIWTINARSLANFLNLRMCNRNTMEMRIFANRLLFIVTGVWVEYAGHLGPDCTRGIRTCRQGKMQCKEGCYEYI